MVEENEGGVYISVVDGDVIIQILHELPSGEWGVHTLHMDPEMAVSFSDAMLVAAGMAVKEENSPPKLTVIKGGKSDDTIH